MSLGMFDENGIWYLNALVPVALTLTGTVEPRLSRFLDYVHFLWFQFGHEYLLVTIKIRSHILFKTTALKSAVKCEGVLLSKSKSSSRCN